MLTHLRTTIVSVLVALLLATTATAQWIADGAPACTASGDQMYLDTVPDGHGGAILVWEDHRSAPFHVYAQRVDAAGVRQWGNDGVLVSSPTHDAGEPVAVADAYGGVILVYLQDRQYGLGLVQSNLFAQRLNDVGVPQWGSGGVTVCQAANVQSSPAIISDGRDPSALPGPGAIVTWMDFRSSPSSGDIYAQGITATGAMRWTPDGIAVCTDPGYQSSPVIVTDGSGLGTGPQGCIIAWNDNRSGEVDIYAQRLSTAGAPVWTPASGFPVCTNPAEQSSPAATFIASGTAIITWVDRRNGSLDLYAQRVGSGSWAADGLPICTAPEDQYSFRMIRDGKGGVIIAWSDPRSANDYDAYAQRVDGTGSPLWASDGAVVCMAPKAQDTPIMVPDLANGAIMAWIDLRASTGNMPGQLKYDLYAQHVDSGGVSRWNASGLPVCTAPGNRFNPRIIGDGSGGAIVTWMDTRNGPLDLYAQHITAGGGVVGVEPARAPSRSIQLFPNPTRESLAIRLGFATARRVTVQILSVDGRLVRSLADGAELSDGQGTLTWDLRDSDRSRVPMGVYFLRVDAGAESGTQRVVVLE